MVDDSILGGPSLVDQILDEMFAKLDESGGFDPALVERLHGLRSCGDLKKPQRVIHALKAGAQHSP